MGIGCTHRGIKKVLEIGTSEVYAGNEREVAANGQGFDLIISLTGTTVRKPLKFRLSGGSTRALSNLNKYMKRRQHNLVIDWPDFQAPDLDLEFWQSLYADIETMAGRVVIHCMGGHGRTGTALAALAHLEGKCFGDGDVVQWIRSVYCQNAVESMAQVNYLRNVIKVQTSVDGAKGFDHPSSGMGKLFGKPERTGSKLSDFDFGDQGDLAGL